MGEVPTLITTKSTSEFERTVNGETILFKNRREIPFVEKLNFFRDDSSGSWLKKEIRWSYNSTHWSPWQALTQSAVSSIKPEGRCLFLEIRYLSSGGVVTSFSINYDEGPPRPIIIEEKEIVSSTSCDTGALQCTVIDKRTVDDAELLQGRDGNYYLLRKNHIGKQTISTITGLTEILNQLINSNSLVNVINVDGSGIGTFFQREPSTLIFRRVAGGPGIQVTDSSGVIMIDSNILFYDSSLSPSLLMPYSVGGWPAGTPVSDLLGKSFVHLWDVLLFPTVLPEFQSPSLSFGVDTSTFLFEVSALVPLQFTTDFSQGSILIAGDWTAPRSGLPTGYDYTGPGLVDISTSSLTDTQSIGFSVGAGETVWEVTGIYSEGPQPLDNKGNPSGSPLPPGGVNASISIEGVWPIFATTDGSLLIKQDLISMQVSTFPEDGLLLSSEIAEEEDASIGERGRFSIPSAWPKTLSGIRTHTPWEVWSYELGDASGSLTRWDVSSSTQIIQGNSVSYNEYTYNGPARSSIKIKLEFS